MNSYTSQELDALVQSNWNMKARKGLGISVYYLGQKDLNDDNFKEILPMIEKREKQISKDSLHFVQLWFYNNSITSRGIQYLSYATLHNLQILYLWQNCIADEGCRQLSQNAWKGLNYLFLDRNQIGNQGCEWLSKSGWNQLKQLHLDGNKITEQGCKGLANSNFKNILISLQYNPINKMGVRYLQNSGWMVSCDQQFYQSEDD